MNDFGRSQTFPLLILFKIPLWANNLALPVERTNQVVSILSLPSDCLFFAEPFLYLVKWIQRFSQWFNDLYNFLSPSKKPPCPAYHSLTWNSPHFDNNLFPTRQELCFVLNLEITFLFNCSPWQLEPWISAFLHSLFRRPNNVNPCTSWGKKPDSLE